MEEPEEQPVVLYVDDEEIACKYFERIAGADYEVLTATSVDDALVLLEAAGERIGVVVTDYRMPGRDGGELLRQIENDHPQVVRVLVTAYADKDLILDTVNNGHVFRILEKPLSLVEVRRTLRDAALQARGRLAERHRLAAMNETLAFMAHELNTPLATVLNFSRGLLQRVADGRLSGQIDEAGRAARAIDANARYCLAILSSFASSLRHASAGSRGGSAGAGSAVDKLDAPGGVTQTATDMVDALLLSYPLSAHQRSTIRVETRDDFTVPAMPNCVSLVISSLMTNALRALQGHPAPLLRICIEGAGPYIRVVDNGPGIPGSVRERLLADPVTTHAHEGGSGRGLLFCQRIMQSFGGSLAIESAPGACAVTLRFPAHASPASRSQ